MGDSRTTSAECKTYLTQLSLEYYELCKAAVGGHYEGDYFSTGGDHSFSLSSAATIRRLRAVIQHMNTNFSDNMRVNGHRYQIDASASVDPDDEDTSLRPLVAQMQVLGLSLKTTSPTKMDKQEALDFSPCCSRTLVPKMLSLVFTRL